MKSVLRIATGGLLLLGLTSCTSVSPVNPDRTQAIVSQPPAQALSDSEGQSASQTAAMVKIAPSSSTQKVLQILAEAYQAKNKTAKVEVLSTISPSRGAIAAFKNHIVDIAGTTHKPKSEEDNGRMQYRELARDVLLVATHPSVKGVTNLTTEQLQAIYTGEISNWSQVGGPNAAIIVLDRPEDESAKKLLRKYYLGQGKTTAKAVLFNREPELIQTLQDTPYTIGPLSLAYAELNHLFINHLSLDGVSPTIQHLTQGQYSMARHMGIVWDKSPSAATQGFINFVFSPQGSQVLQTYGFVPEN